MIPAGVKGPRKVNEPVNIPIVCQHTAVRQKAEAFVAPSLCSNAKQAGSKDVIKTTRNGNEELKVKLCATC